MSDDVLAKAKAGDLGAIRSVALLYELGMDRERDLDEAKKWWDIAAKSGDKWAVKRVTEISEEIKKQPKKKKLSSQVRPPNTGKKILIVDDEEEIRESVREILEIKGYRVVEAVDGSDALKVIGSNPDIAMVFLDLKMPNVGGLELLKMMKSMKYLEGIAKVIVTAHASKDIIDAVKSLEASAFLVKPASSEKLLECIEKFAA